MKVRGVRVEIYRDMKLYTFLPGEVKSTQVPSSGKWRWRYWRNGNIMAGPQQGYVNRADCLESCATVLGAEVYADRIGTFLVRGTEAIPVRDLTKAKP